MNEPKFTPGPWLNQENMAGYADIVIPGEHIAMVAKETNANLIASAPDLYAALEGIANADQGEWQAEYRTPTEFRRWAKNVARAALAKAVSHD